MYIFKPPAKSYDIPFTYEALQAFVQAGKSGWVRKIGTTLEVSTPYAGYVKIRLYDTVIAELLSNGYVRIMEAIDNHGSQATSHWVGKVLMDNGIAAGVYRENGRYAVAGMTAKRDI